MPSKDELNLMYQNIGPGNALGLGNIGGFSSAYYWSFSEATNILAWDQRFNFGVPSTNDKSSTYSVLAVRAF